MIPVESTSARIDFNYGPLQAQTMCLNGRPDRRASGMTLVELLLGLVIASMVFAAVAAMLFAASSGTANAAERRGFSVSCAATMARLGFAIRSSQLVLAKGDNYLILWMAETTQRNGRPNTSEIQRIEWDPDRNELQCWKARDDLAEAEDTSFNLAASNYLMLTDLLKGGGFFTSRLWATDVTGWSTVLDAADPREAAFVSYRLTLAADGTSKTAIGGAALRNW